MASAKEFVARVAGIDGVAGCLLLRDDGVLVGQTIDDPEVYSSLLLISGGLAGKIMKMTGFSNFRHIGFNRRAKNHFYVFLIDKYLLGVVQHDNCQIAEMLESVHHLISRVSTNRSAANISGS